MATAGRFDLLLPGCERPSRPLRSVFAVPLYRFRHRAIDVVVTQSPVGLQAFDKLGQHPTTNTAMQIARPEMGAWDTADLAELRDWVEGLRAAAHKARGEGNITLAEALDLTRHEVYVSYVDEDYTTNEAKRLNRNAATR